MRNESESPTERRRWILLLVAALAVWGLYHAVGAFLFNHDIRRGLVVLACMAAFVGWWVFLLRLHAKRRGPAARPGVQHYLGPAERE